MKCIKNNKHYCALRMIKRLYERDIWINENKNIVEYRVINKLGSENDENKLTNVYGEYIQNKIGKSAFSEISGAGIKRKNTIGNNVYIMINIKKY